MADVEHVANRNCATTEVDREALGLDDRRRDLAREGSRFDEQCVEPLAAGSLSQVTKRFHEFRVEAFALARSSEVWTESAPTGPPIAFAPISAVTNNARCHHSTPAARASATGWSSPL